MPPKPTLVQPIGYKTAWGNDVQCSEFPAICSKILILRRMHGVDMTGKGFVFGIDKMRCRGMHQTGNEET